MQKMLFILNKGPYGSEESYNGLRLAGAVLKEKQNEVKVFFIGDAAACSKSGQKVPQGFYNIELMIKNIVRGGGPIGVCGTCMDARGIHDDELIDGTHKSTLSELTEWTIEADKVLTF
ncbi:DsrE family protein [Bacteriovoracaceae bacterium]|nr:DsrE family protein [Bacteriovoracaceae bacterium]